MQFQWLAVGVNVESKVKQPTQCADKATEFDLNLMESEPDHSEMHFPSCGNIFYLFIFFIKWLMYPNL